MDVSGTLTDNPNKDAETYAFFNALLSQFDTTNQVKLSIATFSDDAVVDMDMGFYNTLEVFESVDNINWVGGLTNIKAGLEAGHSTIDTTDDVTDVMLVISDGFDSISAFGATSYAQEIAADGVNMVTVAWGQNGFYYALTMMQIANYFSTGTGYFPAGSSAELMDAVGPIMAAICSAGKNHINRYPNLLL